MTSAEASPIELLYTRLIANEKLKAGTALERVTALVFFALMNEEATVVHQVRLRGSGASYHWIDVVATRAGETRRTLIECKDYTNEVGLEEALVFGGRLAQFPHDDAFMVTTVGFTKDALTYLADQEVQPVIFRPVGFLPDSADAKLVKKIVLKIDMHVDTNIKVELRIADEPGADEFVAANTGLREWPQGDGLYALDGPFVEPLTDALERAMAVGQEWPPKGQRTAELEFEEPRLLEMDGKRTKLTGLAVSWDHVIATQTVTKEAGALPALVVANVRGDIERVFSDAEILELGFAEDGKTVLRRLPT